MSCDLIEQVLSIFACIDSKLRNFNIHFITSSNVSTQSVLDLSSSSMIDVLLVLLVYAGGRVLFGCDVRCGLCCVCADYHAYNKKTHTI